MKQNSLLLVLIIIISISCKSDYTKAVQRELDSGIVNDSLILGMFMGQTQKEFFAHCWDLNKQRKISHGSGNNYAKKYILADSSEDPSMKMTLLFYGIFDKDKVMRGMDMRYQFTAWAPWNKSLNSDALLEHLKKKYIEGYPSNEFMKVKSKNLNRDAYAKVDGNRQIVMYPIDEKEVSVKIEDLRYKMK